MAAPSLPAADTLKEEKLATENSKWEQIGTKIIDDSLLVVNTDGNSYRAENIEDTESVFRVVLEGIERFRQFEFGKECNKIVSVLSCNVKYVKRFFST